VRWCTRIRGTIGGIMGRGRLGEFLLFLFIFLCDLLGQWVLTLLFRMGKPLQLDLSKL
jgi:hypothetical protein